MKNVGMNQWNTRESCGTRLVSHYREKPKHEFFTYHEYVFKRFLRVLTACMIVFESTEIMTKFLAYGGGLSCTQVWSFTWFFFSETGLKMRIRSPLFWIVVSKPLSGFTAFYEASNISHVLHWCSCFCVCAQSASVCFIE